MGFEPTTPTWQTKNFNVYSVHSIHQQYFELQRISDCFLQPTNYIDECEQKWRQGVEFSAGQKL